MSNPKYRDLPAFFAENNVEVISSLPHYSALRTDSQRGDGVFEDSIKAMKLLNDAGFGKEGSGLKINLVYNPSGAFLPGNQASLEADFKRQLKRKYDLDFNNLYAITNMPISRFLDYLLESGNYESYMQTLIDAFNPAAVSGVMCRNTISVSWDGYLYDCDFNQMLDLKVDLPGEKTTSVISNLLNWKTAKSYSNSIVTDVPRAPDPARTRRRRRQRVPRRSRSRRASGTPTSPSGSSGGRRRSLRRRSPPRRPGRRP